MPRKTIKSEIVELAYFNACMELMDTSVDSEIEEIENNLMTDFLTVRSRKLVLILRLIL